MPDFAFYLRRGLVIVVAPTCDMLTKFVAVQALDGMFAGILGSPVGFAASWDAVGKDDSSHDELIREGTCREHPLLIECSLQCPGKADGAFLRALR